MIKAFKYFLCISKFSPCKNSMVIFFEILEKTLVRFGKGAKQGRSVRKISHPLKVGLD